MTEQCVQNLATAEACSLGLLPTEASPALQNRHAELPVVVVHNHHQSKHSPSDPSFSIVCLSACPFLGPSYPSQVSRTNPYRTQWFPCSILSTPSALEKTLL